MRLRSSGVVYRWGRLPCVLQALTSRMMHRLLSGELDIRGAPQHLGWMTSPH